MVCPSSSFVLSMRLKQNTFNMKQLPGLGGVLFHLILVQWCIEIRPTTIAPLERSAIMKMTKRMLALLLVFVTVCSLVAVPASAATTGFGILSDSHYAVTYLLSPTGTTTPYVDKGLQNPGTITYGKSKNAYISNERDDLKLMEVDLTGGRWAKVAYPNDARTKWMVGYIPLSAITENNGSHAKTVSTGKFSCAARKDGPIESKYYVAKGDTVYLIAVSGSRCQVLYPTSKGLYRLAWCSKSDYEKYCGPVNAASDTAGMTDVTAYFAGQTIYLNSIENGQYLCADKNVSNTPALCNRPSTTTWTRFTVSSLTADGWVGLKAYANSKWLSATINATDNPLRAVAGSLQSWECFRIYLKGNDFYLKAQANGKWLCVRVDKSGAPVQAYANAPSTWERFGIHIRGMENNLSTAELIRTALENGIGAGTKAWKALCSINSKYAKDLTASQESGIQVYLFEGVGSNAATDQRMNAMCVLVKNHDVVYLSRNCSTIPDFPFSPSRNDGKAMPTLKSGIYNVTTVNHKGYAALHVNGDSVIRHKDQNRWYTSTSGQINIHRRSLAYLPASGIPNSQGCLLIGSVGTKSGDEYARFIQALGIVNAGDPGNRSYRRTVTGKLILDRTYAYDYLRNVGYSDSAIQALG